MKKKCRKEEKSGEKKGMNHPDDGDAPMEYRKYRVRRNDGILFDFIFKEIN